MDPHGSYVFSSVPLDSKQLEKKNSYIRYKDARVLVKFGRPDSNLIFRWKYGNSPTQTVVVHPPKKDVDRDKETVWFHKGMKSSTRLWGVLGNPKGFNLLEEKDDFRVIYFKTPKDLPLHSPGFQSLDALLIVGDYEIPQKNNSALEKWVRMGGNLFVSVGQGASAYQKSLLSQWTPIPVTGQRIFDSMSKIESFSDKKQRIRFNGRVQGAQMLDVEGGNILIGDSKAPLLQRLPYGFGVVTLFAIDVTKPPLSKWRMLPSLLHKMVEGMRGVTAHTEKEESKALSQSGITELKTQLMASVENYPKVKRVSSWYVMGAMLIFLLLIGPVDYFIVCHLLKKPHLTWVTLPLIVLLAVGWGVTMARRTNGEKLRLNQLELIDIDSSTGSLRIQNWYSLYSPTNQRYELQSIPDNASWKNLALSKKDRLIWSGNPEDSYTGMYRTGGVEFERPEYRLMKDHQGIQNLPIPLWSTQNLSATQQARWSRPTKENQSAPLLFESHFESTGSGQLEGVMISRLPLPITEWMVIYKGRVYQSLPGKKIEIIQPNVPVVFSFASHLMKQHDLKNFLTEATSRNLEEENEEEAFSGITEYDSQNRNIEDIVRTLSFHNAAGGTNYTQLKNHFLQHLDLSLQLRLGQAVLFGRIQQPVSQLQIKTAKKIETPVLQSDTFVRILLPVKKTIETNTPLPDFNEK